MPLAGRPAVSTAVLAVTRELALALLVIDWPAVIAAVPPVGTNKSGVVPTATAAVCMKLRTAVDDVTRAALVSRTDVLLRMRSIFVSAGMPGPVTSMPVASASVEGRPVTWRLPAVVRPRKSIVSSNVQLVLALVAPWST